MINKQESILYCTDQAWKYNASLAVDWLAIFIATGAIYFYSYQSWQFVFCLVVAGLLSITGFVIAFRIKCPKCRALWYWQALKTPIGNDGLGKFRSQKECPTCGFPNNAGR